AFAAIARNGKRRARAAHRLPRSSAARGIRAHARRENAGACARSHRRMGTQQSETRWRDCGGEEENGKKKEGGVVLDTLPALLLSRTLLELTYVRRQFE